MHAYFLSDNHIFCNAKPAKFAIVIPTNKLVVFDYGKLLIFEIVNSASLKSLLSWYCKFAIIYFTINTQIVGQDVSNK